MMPRSSAKPVPDFGQLQYFKESGWLGFGMMVWATYFSAPLYARFYKAYDLIPDEFAILASLYDGGSLSAQTICTITGRPKNSISRGVTRLLAAGRISRTPNPNDRRESFLSLLAEGRKLYERLMPMCREREEELLKALSTDELVTLDTLLQKMMLFYHQSREGVGLESLQELGIPSQAPSEKPLARLRGARKDPR